MAQDRDGNPFEETQPPSSDNQPEQPALVASETKKSWRLYLILISLGLLSFVASLDGSIIAIALPEIVKDTSAENKYVWIANSFLIAQTVVQPFCAQLSNIFGRKMTMITSIGIFAIGSGIAGGSNSAASLIAGRTVQGLGSGGMFMLVELITCDLFSLRERGKYLGYVQSAAAIGVILGPVVGGALATANWRWIFYMNIPFAGITITVMWLILRLNHEKSGNWKTVIARIDWLGNIIFIASICSLLLGLVFGGTVFPWSSWRVILPIILGAIGWICFHLYELAPLIPCEEVVVPPRIIANRTSLAGFYMDFLSSMLLQWIAFWWPVYFQAIKGTSPLRSGVCFIPFEAFLIITAAVAGGLLTKFGSYRPLHFVGFTLSVLGPGLNIMLSDTTPKAVWVILQVIDAIGRGLLLPTLLPSIMASLPDSDAASVTGLFSFLRSFGFVWGVTVPALIFNAQVNRSAGRITDVSVRQSLEHGRAYQLVSGGYIQSLPPALKREVISIFTEALQKVWIGAVGFGATGFLAIAVEKHIPLRTELDTKYGLQNEDEMQGEKNSSTEP